MVIQSKLLYLPDFQVFEHPIISALGNTSKVW